MRFSVLVGLLMVALVGCCYGFASGESFPVSPNKDVDDRRLQNIGEAATHFISGQVDDQLLKKAGKLLNAAKGDEAAIAKSLNLAAAAKAAAKLSDDEVAKISAMVKEARGDEAHAMRYILGFSQKEGKHLTDESTALVAAKIADTVAKHPKSSSRLRKFAMIALGVATGGLAMYGAYKLLFDRNANTEAPTTTTSG